MAEIKAKALPFRVCATHNIYTLRSRTYYTTMNKIRIILLYTYTLQCIYERAVFIYEWARPGGDNDSSVRAGESKWLSGVPARDERVATVFI